MVSLTKSCIEVVVAVIENNSGAVLVAKRAVHKHLGGLWEFPGGKLEAGETQVQALKREIYEELGLVVIQAKPLTSLHHVYPEQDIVLHVWHVTQFTGQAYGREQQPIAWVDRQDLAKLDFPAANREIIAWLLNLDY